MSNENQDEQRATVLASANLTVEQVELFLVKSLLAESEQLSAAVDGKQIEVRSSWQTSKWSNPDALVSFFFVEAPEADAESSDEESEPESTEDAGDDSGEDAGEDEG